ncbi:MAG: heparinase II/III family protein [Planctomycetaceae bacterium]
MTLAKPNQEEWPVSIETVGVGRRLSRIASILRYHRPTQLAFRAMKVVRRRLRSRTADSTTGAPLPLLRGGDELRQIAGRKLSARDCREVRDSITRFRDRRFCFLNREVQLEAETAALPPALEVSQLWRFHFHYHEFLLDVVKSALDNDDVQAVAEIWDFVATWIAEHRSVVPDSVDDPWHPFCISRRLPVWISIWMVAPPADVLQERILTSLLQQTLVLNDNMEWDLGGNHLLENLRALALVAAFVSGNVGDAFRKRVERFLPGELASQILEHGEHFERSPMYHAIMLEAILDIRDAFGTISPRVSRQCRDVAIPIAMFLEAILHPDRDIPLLGDSALRSSAPPVLLIEAARIGAGNRGIQNDGVERIGPYWIWREEAGHQLLFDAGAVGADDLPAHAHCDLLGLEISVAGKRVVVDSGVYDYGDGNARRYCRSTAAHNVLEVDARNQCDIWSKFRRGYRGRASMLHTVQQSGFETACASHDGYRRLGVPRVSRWVACRPGGPWLIVDRAEGSGKHRLMNRLHLHPSVRCERKTASRVAIVNGNATFYIDSLGTADIGIEEGWYCEEFGKRERQQVIVCCSEAVLPQTIGWCLSFHAETRPAELFLCEKGAVSVLVDGTLQLDVR